MDYIDYNNAGQIIQIGDQKINYSEEELLNNVIQRKLTNKNANNEDVFCDLVWQDINFCTCIGNNNSIIPYDFDNDGILEIIVNANYSVDGVRGFWYVLKYKEEINEYVKIYVSDFYENVIQKMILEDLNQDGIDDLVLNVEDKIHVIDLIDYSTLFTIQLDDIQFPYVRHIEFVDLDGNGILELIASSYNNLYIININTFEVEYFFELFGSFFDIGNVDSDPSLEIVFGTGLVFEFTNDGVLIEEYDFRPGFDGVSRIELTDFNADGIEEAVIADLWDNVFVFDIMSSVVLQTIDVFFDIDVMILSDINDDGIKEVIVGEGQWGSVFCFELQSGELIWEIENPDYGISGITICDVDSDGEREIVWGSGCFSSGVDHIYVYTADQFTQSLEWVNEDRGGPFTGIEIADLNQDGQKEIITLCPFNVANPGNGIFRIFNAETKELKYESDRFFFDADNLFSGYLQNIQTIDYLSDGDTDLLFASRKGSSPAIWIVDGDSLYIEREQLLPTDLSTGFKFIEFGDVNDDEEKEFIVSSFTPNKQIIILDSNFDVLWQGDSYENGIVDLVIGDVDGDSKNDIIVCEESIHKYENGTYAHTQIEIGYVAVNLYDWDNDGELEIIAGTENGEIRIIDGNTLEVLETFLIVDPLNFVDQDFKGIEIADLDNDGEPEIVVTSTNKIYFIETNGEFAISQSFTSRIGEYDALKISDYNDDGEMEIFLGTFFRVVELNASCMQNIVTSISNENNEIEDILTIYPNPAKDQINISYKGKEPIQEIRLFSIDGKLIIEETASDFNYHTINLPEVAPGYYVLRLKFDEQYVFKKVLLE